MPICYMDNQGDLPVLPGYGSNTNLLNDSYRRSWLSCIFSLLALLFKLTIHLQSFKVSAMLANKRMPVHLHPPPATQQVLRPSGTPLSQCAGTTAQTACSRAHLQLARLARASHQEPSRLASTSFAELASLK